MDDVIDGRGQVIGAVVRRLVSIIDYVNPKKDLPQAETIVEIMVDSHAQ